MKKRKSTIDLMLESRRTWTINPITRVHDNNTKKDIKKQRQNGKKSCREYVKDTPQDFYFTQRIEQGTLVHHRCRMIYYNPAIKVMEFIHFNGQSE